MAQIIYGIHPVEEILRSADLRLEKLLVSKQETHFALDSVVKIAHQKRIPIAYVEREVLDRMAKGGLHQNVIGIIKEIPYKSVEEILLGWKHQGTKALLLILDSIQDPQNLGAIIRTASGTGVHGMIIPRERAVGITPSVIKASAGGAAHLPISRVVNIASTIDRLKKEGIWVYGAAGEAKERIDQIDFKVDSAIVIGGEGKGIRPLVKKKCDQLFSIPMKGPLSSFNASVSAGMILYEVMRQRSLCHSPLLPQSKDK